MKLREGKKGEGRKERKKQTNEQTREEGEEEAADEKADGMYPRAIAVFHFSSLPALKYHLRLSIRVYLSKINYRRNSYIRSAVNACHWLFTSSIPEAQVRETPDIAKPHSKANAGHDELQMAAPSGPRLCVVLKSHVYLTS